MDFTAYVDWIFYKRMGKKTSSYKVCWWQNGRPYGRWRVSPWKIPIIAVRGGAEQRGTLPITAHSVLSRPSTALPRGLYAAPTPPRGNQRSPAPRCARRHERQRCCKQARTRSFSLDRSQQTANARHLLEQRSFCSPITQSSPPRHRSSCAIRTFVPSQHPPVGIPRPCRAGGSWQRGRGSPTSRGQPAASQRRRAELPPWLFSEVCNRCRNWLCWYLNICSEKPSSWYEVILVSHVL